MAMGVRYSHPQAYALAVHGLLKYTIIHGLLSITAGYLLHQLYYMYAVPSIVFLLMFIPLAIAYLEHLFSNRVKKKGNGPI